MLVWSIRNRLESSAAGGVAVSASPASASALGYQVNSLLVYVLTEASAYSICSSWELSEVIHVWNSTILLLEGILCWNYFCLMLKP